MKKIFTLILIIVSIYTSTMLTVYGRIITPVYNGEFLTINFSISPNECSEISNTESLPIEDYTEYYHDVSDPNLTSYLEKYNCHFFTFFFTVDYRHSAIDYELYGLEDDANKFLRIGQYINSGVYEETDRKHAEIIAYYDSNGILKHTGRVIESIDGIPNSSADDSNLVTVVSKWEYGYIYKHRGDVYSILNQTSYVVKYFAYYHEHSINYTDLSYNSHRLICNEHGSNYCKLNILVPHEISYISNNNLSHKIICSECGYEINSSASHCDFTYTNINENNHKRCCGYCNYNALEPHDWNRLNDLLFICNDCNARARYVPIIHNGINNVINSLTNSTIIYYEGQYYLLIIEENIYE